MLRRVVVFAMLVGIVAVTGSTASARHAPRMKGATNSTSLNWSGYAVTAPTPFTDVKGSWTQPAASCSGNGKGPKNYSSFWVGLDGDTSGTVEQTGTDSDCNGSTAVYYGWYEFYPAYPVNFSNPVQPGDAMTGEVSVSGGVVTITLTDATEHWTQTASQPDTGYSLSSAEWIAEAPSNGNNVLPLADFDTVNFTGATATGGGTSGSIGAFTNDPITMATKKGETKAAPSELDSGGSSFSVTWSHS